MHECLHAARRASDRLARKRTLEVPLAHKVSERDWRKQRVLECDRAEEHAQEDHKLGVCDDAHRRVVVRCGMISDTWRARRGEGRTFDPGLELLRQGVRLWGAARGCGRAWHVAGHDRRAEEGQRVEEREDHERQQGDWITSGSVAGGPYMGRADARVMGLDVNQNRASSRYWMFCAP